MAVPRLCCRLMVGVNGWKMDSGFSLSAACSLVSDSRWEPRAGIPPVRCATSPCRMGTTTTLVVGTVVLGPRVAPRPPGIYAERPRDELPECVGSIHHLSPELRIPALQLKREWSPWPQFGSDPGKSSDQPGSDVVHHACGLSLSRPGVGMAQRRIALNAGGNRSRP
jgi:hypothetical protein